MGQNPPVWISLVAPITHQHVMQRHRTPNPDQLRAHFQVKGIPIFLGSSV